ncbi:MAG: transcriptional regulator [Candidatus Competibacteraceae bacterium]
MNRIEITVMKPQAALDAFATAWRRTEDGETAITPQLAFGSLRDLFSALTEKRLELLRYIATHEGLNIRQVAQAVGRNYKNVYTDVKDLVELGLLERNEQDHLSAPFDEIVIHAGLRDAA